MKRALILLICIIIFSCKATKGIVNNTETLKINTETIISSHYANKSNFKTLKTTIKTTIKSNDKDVHYDAKVRILKDEKIWISIGKMGVTGVKLLISPNSVKYYNKIDKKYFDGNFSLFNSWLGTELSFKQLQSILLGETFFPLEKNSYKHQIIENGYLLTPIKQKPLLEHFITINANNFKIKAQEIAQNEEQRILNIEYLKYEEIENTNIPSEIQLFLLNKTSETQVAMIYKNISLNQELRFPFKIPSNFNEISFEK